MGNNFKATVQFEVRVDLTDRWGKDCTMEQIRKQAVESARRVMGEILAPVDDTMEAGRPAKWKDAAAKLVTPGKLLHVTVSETR